MVCRLSAGGRRIRTCGPTSNGIAVEGAPGNGRRLDLTFKGFGYHACIRIGRPTELSQERGLVVQIRFPPASSQRRTRPRFKRVLIPDKPATRVPPTLFRVRASIVREGAALFCADHEFRSQARRAPYRTGDLPSGL